MGRSPCAQARTTEEPHAGILHLRVCAGGRWITSVPIAEAVRRTIWQKKKVLRG